MPDNSASIALVLSLSFNYCRQVLRGVRQFARTKNWMPYLVVPQPNLRKVLLQLKPAGVIAHAYNNEIADALIDIGSPVVSVSRSNPNVPFPQVNVEEMSIGSMAAEHLIECGLRHFGYFGPSRYGPDTGREGGFYKALQRIPHTVSTCHAALSTFDPLDTMSASADTTREWIRGLTKPVGIFTPGDPWSLWLSDLCRQESVRVPDDVAIIGVDNDNVVCELTQPSLSSIAIPAERVGYHAAALLDGLMAGAAPPSGPVLLDPLGVVARQSSDMLAVDDPDLASAIRYIREHARAQISVNDIVDNVAISRRSLERKFRNVLGHSPTEEIQRLRVARAKSLLESTDLQMGDIALRAGFASPKQLSTVFHQVVGMTPTQYRRSR